MTNCPYTNVYFRGFVDSGYIISVTSTLIQQPKSIYASLVDNVSHSTTLTAMDLFYILFPLSNVNENATLLLTIISMEAYYLLTSFYGRTLL